MLYDAAKKAKVTSGKPKAPNAAQNNRWTNLIKSKDSKQIWNAINWNGNFDSPVDQQDKPTDEDFCKHFSKLLNPVQTDIPMEYGPSEQKYIPILDDPIAPRSQGSH